MKTPVCDLIKNAFISQQGHLLKHCMSGSIGCRTRLIKLYVTSARKRAMLIVKCFVMCYFYTCDCKSLHDESDTWMKESSVAICVPCNTGWRLLLGASRRLHERQVKALGHEVFGVKAEAQVEWRCVMQPGQVQVGAWWNTRFQTNVSQARPWELLLVIWSTHPPSQMLFSPCME